MTTLAQVYISLLVFKRSTRELLPAVVALEISVSASILLIQY